MLVPNDLTRAFTKRDAPRSRPAAYSSLIIPAHPLGSGPKTKLVFFPLEQVAYFFRGSALEANLIRTTWPSRPNFVPHRIYIRTTKGGVYQAKDRSLAELMRRFGENLYLIHQSLLINRGAVVEAELQTDVATVGMRVVPPGIDQLQVARRRLPGLRKELLGRAGGRPNRARRAPNPVKFPPDRTDSGRTLDGAPRFRA